MATRITCTDCNKVPTSGSPLVFNTNDNFKLTYRFVNKNFNPPMNIPLDSFDFSVRYFIQGRSEMFTASKFGRTTENCILYPELSMIKVLFKDHGLKAGHLYGEFTFRFLDPEMPDRIGELTETKFTNIILMDSNI